MLHRRFRPAFVTLLVTVLLAPLAARQAPPDAIPFDPAVRTGTLSNGLRYFIRKNARPANRVLLRLAVKTGSLDEADDQQGLAHVLEHMAFNGSEHFKPGELISYFESTGARLGPHVNAQTGFEDTIYMLDLPSDKPDVVAKGMTAFADFAGGLTLDPKEIDKERGVVIEEWRGGLGAGSRIRDKQIPVLFYHSKYADRLPIGKPDILRNFPPARLKAFYDTFYRPDRMAVVAVGDMDPETLQKMIETAFSGLRPRAPAPPARSVTVPLHEEPLFSIVTDPEVTQSSVTLLRKRPRQYEKTVADYRQSLVQQLFEQMLNDRFDEISRRPDAKFLGAGTGSGPLSQDVEIVSLGAATEDGKLADGLNAVAVEAKRAREFGFGAAELERARKWTLALYERAYTERDKSESGSFAQEYLNYFLESEPAPGIEYEYKLVQQLLPTVTLAEVSALAKTLLSEDGRVILATSPEKAGVKVPTEADLKAALASAEAASVTAWTDTTTTKALVDPVPDPAAITSRRTVDAVGLTIVTFANGVEAWLKPTDFKNDQVIFSLQAKGGLSLAPPDDFVEAQYATSFVSISGAAGMNAVDLQKQLAGKIASASPYSSLSTHGIDGSAAPAQLETALQLLYARFTTPGNDAEAFELMKRQLTAAVVNRLDSPEAVFGDTIEDVNTSGHYTSKPLTVDRVNALDRGKMVQFYKDRFNNAADFTFYMVGAFTIDQALPLLQRYIGGLPSTGTASSTFKDVGIHFPSESKHVTVEKGREPKAQTIISFYAEPAASDPMEQERALAATDILELALRDILREELGQTYTVSVGLAQAPPQTGGGHIEVSFGAAPENIDKMTARVLQEVRRFREEGPTEAQLNTVKETARRNYETSLKTNAYWLNRFKAVQMYRQDPAIIATRVERINALTVASVKAAFDAYFPLDRTTTVTLLPAPTK